jgi:hypothetical protein
MRPYLKNKQYKKGWQHGWSGRAPALQTQGHGINPSTHTQNKQTKEPVNILSGICQNVHLLCLIDTDEK